MRVYFTGMMVTGVIEDTEENEYSVNVKVRFDHPHQWGDKPDFQTMIVVFGEPISQIDRSVFEDVSTWSVSSLQGWINSYESVRFVAINDYTAVITGEYNFEQVKVWLEKNVPIQSLKIS